MSFDQKISKIKKLLDEGERLVQKTRTSVTEADKKLKMACAILKGQQ